MIVSTDNVPRGTKRIEADRLWRDPAARLRYEQDMGYEPLADANLDFPKWNEQAQSGHIMNYHHNFGRWVKTQ